MRRTQYLPALAILATAWSLIGSVCGQVPTSPPSLREPIFSSPLLDAEWVHYLGEPGTAEAIAAESPPLPTFEVEPLRPDRSPLGCTTGVDSMPPQCGPFDVSSLGMWSQADLFGRAVRSDYCEFYSRKTLIPLTVVFGVGAVMANSDIDESFQEAYQTGIRDPDARNAIHQFKVFGEGEYVLAASAAAMLAGALADHYAVGAATREWGSRNLRTFAVGAPPLIALQWTTGASRPGESSAGSRWNPYQDSNGVSGHAFVGAIPFLSAAKMSDGLVAKSFFYAGSTLCGWSRINDDAHYSSQVVLGWCLAYLSASAVDRSQSHLHGAIVPWTPPEGGSGLGWEWRR